jgi:hypothetical protein
MKRAERPLYPLRRTKDEDRDAPADDAVVSLYDLSVPKTPSIGFAIASESEHIVGCSQLPSFSSACCATASSRDDG